MSWRKRVAHLDITDTVFPVVAMTANEAELA